MKHHPKSALLMAAAFAITAILFGQQQLSKEPDPGGWGKAKWGMTRDQAVKAFGGIAKEVQDHGQASLAIHHYDISSEINGEVVLYEVGISFDSRGLVDGATLRPEKAGRPSRLTAQLAKSILLQQLIDKYGQPSDEVTKTSISTDEAWTWLFPSTVIQFRYSAFRLDSELDSVQLTYRLRMRNPGL